MIDETILKTIDFAKQGGLVPAVVQDYKTKEVLMLAYMNAESLQVTLTQKKPVIIHEAGIASG